MVQRLPIALAQVTAGKTFEYLLNKIKQIIYSMYRAKWITKKCITIYWIQYGFSTKIDTISMHSKNNETSDPHTVLISLTDKKNLNYLMDHSLYQIFKIILNIY